MWLLSKAGAIAAVAYLGFVIVTAAVLEYVVTDPIALPLWGVLLSFPGSVIVGTPGHIYDAIAFNVVTMYLTVAFFSAKWSRRI